MTAFLHEIIEARMTGKPTGRRRIQVIHDLTNDDSYFALKRAADDRKERRRRGKIS